MMACGVFGGRRDAGGLEVLEKASKNNQKEIHQSWDSLPLRVGTCMGNYSFATPRMEAAGSTTGRLGGLSE